MGTIKLGILIEQRWTKARKSLSFSGDPSHLQLAKPKNWCSKTYLSNNSSDRPNQLYKSGWVQSSTKRIPLFGPKSLKCLKKFHTPLTSSGEKRGVLFYLTISLLFTLDMKMRVGTAIIYIYITSQTHINDLDARLVL